MSFAARFAFAALAVGLVAPHAIAGELLLNRGFETGTTEEWRKLGAGTIRADAAQRRDGAFSLALEPFLTTVGVRQSLSVGEVVGRRVTISGWMKTVAGTSGIRTSLALSTATGYSSTCDAVFPAALPWTHFTVSCDLGSDFYFAAARFDTTTASGSVRLDTLSVVTEGDPAPFVVTKRRVAQGALPEGAALLAVSTRHREVGKDGIIGAEIYALRADGSDATRISFSGRGHMHVALSPDRTLIAAQRFLRDIGNDGKYDEFIDPAAVFVIDLVRGEEWQILPDWLQSGAGGVVWSQDGGHLYFGVFDGKYCRIHRARPDGSELTLLAPGDDWQSDVGISTDGAWLTYHHQERAPDDDFVKLGTIHVMRADGSEDRAVTDSGGDPPGQVGSWSNGDYDPEFSPDGSQLVFAHKRTADDGWDLMRVDADGGDRTAIVAGSAVRIAGIPDWHSDDLILFSEWLYSPLGFPIYVGASTVRPDGTDLRRLEGPFADPLDGGTRARWFEPELVGIAPAEVTGVRVERGASDTVRVSWDPSCDGVDFALYGGSLASLVSGRYDHTALDCSDDGANHTESIELPANGYVIVVARETLSEGSYGTSSAGRERDRGLTTCRPSQRFGACP